MTFLTFGLVKGREGSVLSFQEDLPNSHNGRVGESLAVNGVKDNLALNLQLSIFPYLYLLGFNEFITIR